jgi:CRP/FNR family transcriptional regulator
MMATSAASVVVPQPADDPLAYLPISTIRDCKKEQVIYSPDQCSSSIYMVVKGKVKVYRIAREGREVLVDIYHVDEFFGDSALIGAMNGHEKAVALEPDTSVMMWTGNEVEELILNRPRLGIALLQITAQRCLHLGWRLESFASDTIERRLARALIRFSERFGKVLEDGSIEMMPLTHAMLSQYVGTSREIITHHMTEFRRHGYLRYSRKEVVIYPDAIMQASLTPV